MGFDGLNTPTNREAVKLTTDVVPVAPRPGTDLVPDGWWESTVMPWADEQTDEQSLQDAEAHIAGMQAAYEQIGADTLELTRARRVIEIRWGELIGPARMGRPPAENESSGATELLDRNDRHEFRKLAEHRDRLVLMLREASDPDALTRRALLRVARAPEAPVEDEPPAPPAPPVVDDDDESPEARLDRKTQRARDALTTQVGRASVAAEAAYDAFDDAIATDPPVHVVERWLAEVKQARRFLSSVSNRLTRRTHDDEPEGGDDE
jgi:hypothetical protein